MAKGGTPAEAPGIGFLCDGYTTHSLVFTAEASGGQIGFMAPALSFFEAGSNLIGLMLDVVPWADLPYR